MMTGTAVTAIPQNEKPFTRTYVKEGRVYVVVVEKDLLGWWLVSRYWGSDASPQSSNKKRAFLTFEDAVIEAEAIHRMRFKRGYVVLPLREKITDIHAVEYR